MACERKRLVVSDDEGEKEGEQTEIEEDEEGEQGQDEKHTICLLVEDQPTLSRWLSLFEVLFPSMAVFFMVPPGYHHAEYFQFHYEDLKQELVPFQTYINRRNPQRLKEANCYIAEAIGSLLDAFPSSCTDAKTFTFKWQGVDVLTKIDKKTLQLNFQNLGILIFLLVFFSFPHVIPFITLGEEYLRTWKLMVTASGKKVKKYLGGSLFMATNIYEDGRYQVEENLKGIDQLLKKFEPASLSEEYPWVLLGFTTTSHATATLATSSSPIQLWGVDKGILTSRPLFDFLTDESINTDEKDARWGNVFFLIEEARRFLCAPHQARKEKEDLKVEPDSNGKRKKVKDEEFFPSEKERKSKKKRKRSSSPSSSPRHHHPQFTRPHVTIKKNRKMKGKSTPLLSFFFLFF